MLLVLQVFVKCKLKYCVNFNFGLTKCVTHPEPNIKVCNKFHGDSSSSCRDISLETTNINLTVEPHEKQRITKLNRIHPQGTMPTHHIVVEIFRSGSNWWNRPIFAMPRSSSLMTHVHDTCMSYSKYEYL